MIDLVFVIRHFGFSAGFLSVVFFGALTGLVGFIVTKDNPELAQRNNKKGFLLVIIFIGAWLYILGGQIFLTRGIAVNIFNHLVAVIWAIITSVFVLSYDDENLLTGFMDDNDSLWDKFMLIFIYLVVWIFGMMAFVGILEKKNNNNYLDLLTPKQEKVESLIVKTKKAIEEEKWGEVKNIYLPQIEKSYQKGEVTAYHLAIAQIRSSADGYKKASKSGEIVASSFKLLEEYSETIDDPFWKGVVAYYKKNYEEASQFFFSSDEVYYAIGSLLVSKDSHNIDKAARALLSFDDEPSLDWLLNLRTNVTKDNEKELAVKAIKNEKDFNNSLFQKIENHVNTIAPLNKSWFYEHPFWFWVILSPTFLISMYTSNFIMRDFIYRQWPVVINSLLIINPLKLFRLLSFHSALAREYTVRLAKAEREKGFFASEIEKIQNNVFPMDWLQGKYYWKKAQKIIQNWEWETEERTDIKRFYQAIKTLSLKAIPHCSNEQEVEIVTAFKEKAGDLSLRYLKGYFSYTKTRRSLLEILKELENVAEILHIQKQAQRGGLSYYDLIGVKEDEDTAEIRRKLRNILTVVHPDKNLNKLEFNALTVLLTQASATLTNETRRRAYDLERRL